MEGTTAPVVGKNIFQIWYVILGDFKSPFFITIKFNQPKYLSSALLANFGMHNAALSRKPERVCEEATAVELC